MPLIFTLLHKSNIFTVQLFCCGTVHIGIDMHYNLHVLIHPLYFSGGDRGTRKIKVILIDFYHHSHLFPPEFPLFPACVHACARLLCLSDCLCFCMCAWVCICYQVVMDLYASECAYICVCMHVYVCSLFQHVYYLRESYNLELEYVLMSVSV